ncbi:MAG: hypothetical protein ACTSRA_09165 [Promethearchaeota archaeon]
MTKINEILDQIWTYFADLFRFSQTLDLTAKIFLFILVILGLVALALLVYGIAWLFYQFMKVLVIGISIFIYSIFVFVKLIFIRIFNGRGKVAPEWEKASRNIQWLIEKAYPSKSNKDKKDAGRVSGRRRGSAGNGLPEVNTLEEINKTKKNDKKLVIEIRTNDGRSRTADDGSSSFPINQVSADQLKVPSMDFNRANSTAANRVLDDKDVRIVVTGASEDGIDEDSSMGDVNQEPGMVVIQSEPGKGNLGKDTEGSRKVDINIIKPDDIDLQVTTKEDVAAAAVKSGDGSDANDDRPGKQGFYYCTKCGRQFSKRMMDLLEKYGKAFCQNCGQNYVEFDNTGFLNRREVVA